MPFNPSWSRRTLLGAGAAAGVAAVAGCTSESADPDAPVTLRVMGFEVSPEEKGSPLDKAYQKFLDDFRTANPNVTLESLETPPDFATKIIVDLAAGTAPDIWSQDASSLAPIVSRKLMLDMRELMKVHPDLTTDRFFPAVLAINQFDDGAIYGLPNDFTPVVTYLNKELIEAAKLDVPTQGWTWDDQLALAQALTKDKSGKTAADSGFDADNVAQWGYRASKYAYLWVYRVWQNGGDVLSPDHTKATGFLDDAPCLEALQWYADLVLKHHVSPAPTVLEQMTQKSSFDSQFLAGKFAMFDSGHWELVGLSGADEWDEAKLAVAPQPKRKQGTSVIYQSSFSVRYDLPEEAKVAAAKFVDAATSAGYQDTKAVTGIALSGNQKVAEDTTSKGKFADFDPAFLAATDGARPPSGAKVPKYPTVENMLNDMMERILKGGDVADEAGKSAAAIDRELAS